MTCITFGRFPHCEKFLGLIGKQMEVVLVRYWKARQSMVQPKLKAMLGLSFSKEISFFV